MSEKHGARASRISTGGAVGDAPAPANCAVVGGPGEPGPMFARTRQRSLAGRTNMGGAAAGPATGIRSIRTTAMLDT